MNRIAPGNKALHVFRLLALVLLGCIGPLAAADNPLIGTWIPMTEQASPRLTQLVPRMGEMRITANTLALFGEPEVEYEYERNGAVFSVLVKGRKARTVEFVLQKHDRLLTKLPNDFHVMWQRADVGPGTSAAATTERSGPTAAGAGTSAASTAGGNPQVSAVLAMTTPQSQPTRYQTVGQSLEALLNDKWSITHAFGGGPSMGMILARDGKHILCMVMGDLRDAQTGRSDCRWLN